MLFHRRFLTIRNIVLNFDQHHCMFTRSRVNNREFYGISGLDTFTLDEYLKLTSMLMASLLSPMRLILTNAQYALVLSYTKPLDLLLHRGARLDAFRAYRLTSVS